MFIDRDVDESEFHNRQDIKKITFGPNARYIDHGAFQHCYNLEEIIMTNVLAIEDWAFYRCRRLRNVKLNVGLLRIGFAAFNYCKELTNIAFEEGLKTIHTAAFADCLKLENVKFPKSLTRIESLAFGGCPINNVELHNITFIGYRAFDNINEDIVDGLNECNYNYSSNSISR